MRFEISNPSDPYTMDADDIEVAAVAVCFLGDGRYGLTGVGHQEYVPIFLLGGHDEWFIKRLGRDFKTTAEDAMDNRTDALARALESVALKDGRTRSSLNDIGARAKALAKAVRRKVPA